MHLIGEKLAADKTKAYTQTVQGLLLEFPPQVFRSVDGFSYLSRGMYPLDDLNPTAPILLHLPSFMACLGLRFADDDALHSGVDQPHSTPRAVSVSELTKWYAQHVSEHLAAGTRPSREASRVAAKNHFKDRASISLERIKDLRKGPPTPHRWNSKGAPRRIAKLGSK